MKKKKFTKIRGNAERDSASIKAPKPTPEQSTEPQHRTPAPAPHP